MKSTRERPTVRVTINPGATLYRHGRWWREGEVLTVSEGDARRICKRGSAAARRIL